MTDGMTMTSLSASLQRKTSNHELCMPRYINKPKIIAYHLAKSHESEHYCINLKSGVNFQVVLKRNCGKRNCVTRDLPVLHVCIRLFSVVLAFWWEDNSYHRMVCVC